MMKKNLFILFLILLGCQNSTENVSIPNTKIKLILEAFAKKYKCKDCINEIYIDKINPHFYQLMIYQGATSLCKEENKFNNHFSSQYVVVADLKFDIYSGVEHYFNNKELKSKTALIDSTNVIPESQIWVVKDSFDIISIKKRPFGYPFMPLPSSKQETDIVIDNVK